MFDIIRRSTGNHGYSTQKMIKKWSGGGGKKKEKNGSLHRSPDSLQENVATDDDDRFYITSTILSPIIYENTKAEVTNNRLINYRT